MAEPRRRAAVVLAAGLGKRMRSRLPKVLHPAAGRPLLAWSIAAARGAGCGTIVVVVGHGAEAVRAAFAGEDLVWAVQEVQRGTGDALACARAPLADRLGADPEVLLVLPGDTPLVRAATLEALAREVEEGGAWGAVAICDVADPGSLGRVVTATDHPGRERLVEIVEAADATDEVLALATVNTGFYALPAAETFAALDELAVEAPANAQGEIYLTDVPTRAAAAGRRVAAVRVEDPAEALGVNGRSELAAAHRALIDRHLAVLQAAGVTVLEPARTVVEPTATVGADSVLHPGVALLGVTAVGAGCVLHQGAWLRNCTLGDGVEVAPYSVLDGAVVEAGARVGPFAHLRPGAELAEDTRAGAFVEVKNARLGRGAKVPHLAYVGDATVGDGANLGAGVVTCNYDGVAKRRTTIGPGAFVGSDTLLVAPVEVGADATTAAGTVVTRDVPPGALAVARIRQKNLPDWRQRRRPRGAQE